MLTDIHSHRHESYLRRRKEETRVREVGLFHEFVDVGAESFRIPGLQTPGLQVDKESFHRSVRVVDRQVVLQLLHQQEFIIEDDTARLFPVAFHVRHELIHGHIKLLHFACQVHTRHEDEFGVIVHHRVIQIKALIILKGCPLFGPKDDVRTGGRWTGLVLTMTARGIGGWNERQNSFNAF